MRFLIGLFINGSGNRIVNPSNRKQITWLILIFVALGLIVNYSRPGKPRTRLILPRTEKIVKKITQAIPDQSSTFKHGLRGEYSNLFHESCHYFSRNRFYSSDFSFFRNKFNLTPLIKGWHIDLPPPRCA